MPRMRKCRVCGCTDECACPEGCYWLSDDDDLCSACEPALAHVITRATSSERKLATCSCGGFVYSYRRGPQGRRWAALQRQAITGHWLAEIEQAADANAERAKQ